MAHAVEQHGLHERLARGVIAFAAAVPGRMMGRAALLLGFVFSTGFLSMWLSNTATSAMMMPLSSAVLAKMRLKFGTKNRQGEWELCQLAAAIDLGIAYAASVGGSATLTGTGSNLVLLGTLDSFFGEAGEVSFLEWMCLATPIAVLNLLLLWAVLSEAEGEQWEAEEAEGKDEAEETGGGCQDGGQVGEVDVQVQSRRRSSSRRNHISAWQYSPPQGRLDEPEAAVVAAAGGAGTAADEVKALSYPEYVLLTVFILMVSLWVTRDPPGNWGWANLLPKPEFVTDGTVAMLCCLLLFVTPAAPPRRWQGQGQVRVRRQGRGYEYSRPGAFGASGSASCQEEADSWSRAHNPLVEVTAVAEGGGDGDEDGDVELSPKLTQQLQQRRQPQQRLSLNPTAASQVHSSDVIDADADTEAGTYFGVGTEAEAEEEAEAEAEAEVEVDEYGAANASGASDDPEGFILSWGAVQRLNWNVIFLLGGGFALSVGFEQSGLDAAVSHIVSRHLQGPGSLGGLVLATSVCATVLTNLVSNVAASDIFLPALACVGPASTPPLAPVYVLAPTVMALSLSLCSAFGTLPNAIVLGAGNVSVREMLKTGLLCSVCCLASLIPYCLFVVPQLYDVRSVPQEVVNACIS
ncbi:Sodium/sulfate symporter [Ochromonadaceae sp. CCMP2298]|nr:Sodium/sulfate symporter [Ochromonadaceae sp. CCMP2298]